MYIPWANGVMNHTGSKGGTFNITITYGPSPFGAEDSLAGISQGLADIGQLSGDTYDLGGIGYLPFMFPSLTSCAYVGYTILHDEVGTWDELAQLRDVKILLVSPLHSANWIGKTKNVILPADIVGVNVRAEAGELPTIAALGANPKTNIALNNLAGQMSGGYVDGGFVTYSAMISYGLLASTTYITQVNLFPRLYSLAINKDVYDGLPSEARQWLDSCCTRDKSVYWAQQHAAAEGYYKSQVVNNLTASGKPAIHVLTAGELDAWKSATSGVKTTWATDMTSLGYNGTALLNRVIALVAAAP
jgi:TRAP-type C4-dicarboxylate transport system substrate-binding protein